MAVVVANLRAALSGTGPVAARMISFFPGKVGRAVILGPCQNVMPVWLVATTVHQIAIFIQSGSLDDIRIYVQLIEIDGNQFSIGVVPWAGSNPITGGLAATFRNLSADICPPRAPRGSGRLG
jgi:hypothetical protein